MNFSESVIFFSVIGFSIIFLAIFVSFSFSVIPPNAVDHNIKSKFSIMTNNYIPEVKSTVIKIVSLSKPYFVGADSNNFDTYENDNYGYSVLYPVNWIQRDLDG